MKLFKSQKEKEYLKMLKDKKKKEKAINKNTETILKKTSGMSLKEANKILTEKAIEIDTSEYEQICKELKERMNNKYL